jgi:hypothetical protein
LAKDSVVPGDRVGAEPRDFEEHLELGEAGVLVSATRAASQVFLREMRMRTASATIATRTMERHPSR